MLHTAITQTTHETHGKFLKVQQHGWKFQDHQAILAGMEMADENNARPKNSDTNQNPWQVAPRTFKISETKMDNKQENTHTNNMQ